MARNQYEDALGVVPLDWQQGEPPSSDTYFPIIVERWSSDIQMDQFSSQPRPHVRVNATLEVWTGTPDGWMVVGYRGQLHKPAHQVRRWAKLGVRNWYHNITLDNWK